MKYVYIYINVLHINSKYGKCDYVISNVSFIGIKKISETLTHVFEYLHTCTVVLNEYLSEWIWIQNHIFNYLSG